MIAILTDKFKGTLSGAEVAEIISSFVDGCVYVPMADGGEGTAEALDARLHGRFYTFIDSDGYEVAFVPSCGEGLPDFPDQNHLPLRERSSAPVGQLVAEALEYYPRVYVGIGGTRFADGGIGFAQALQGAKGEIIGLADVQAPLIAAQGISALSFLRQKGADDEDYRYLTALYRRLKEKYPSADRYGGAGGGVGFAIESILGSKVISGAEYVLKRNLKRCLNDSTPDLLITGEGCVDEQTAAGKVVETVSRYGAEQGIPVVIFAGTTRGNPPYPHVFRTADSGALPSHRQAAENLRQACMRAIPLISKLLSN